MLISADWGLISGRILHIVFVGTVNAKLHRIYDSFKSTPFGYAAFSLHAASFVAVSK